MAARLRRSSSQQTLAVRQEGPGGGLLAEALRVPEEGAYTLTHGFHPYPGRFHPHLPRTLLAALAKPGRVLLDPVMGGGTTLVEAMLQGVAATGNDLNPVAVLVARERTRPRSGAEARAVADACERIGAEVEGLRRERNPPRASLPGLPKLAPHYQPHLLAELAQWLRLIDGLAPGAGRETLRAVFSSGAVKFSNRASDSQQRSAPPRYPKGAPSRFFVEKCQELLRAQVLLGRLLPQPPPPVTLLQEDARLLPSLGWGAFDLILTSPPYPGTYDYLDHHALRLAWLGLDAGPFAGGELGARRAGAAGRGWSEGYRDLLVALARVLRPGGDLLLVIGDWMESGHAVDGAAVLSRLAREKGWRLVSAAAARRAIHSHAEKKAYARRGKWEHLLHFTRAGVSPEPAERPTAAPARPAQKAAQPARRRPGPRQPAPRQPAPNRPAPRQPAPNRPAPRQRKPP